MMGKQKRYFSDYYKTITHVQNVNAQINAHISTIEKRVVADKEDVVQILPFLQLTYFRYLR